MMPSAFTRVTSFVVFALLIPLLSCTALWVTTPSPRWNEACFVIVLVLVYSGARLGSYYAGGEPRFLGVVFFVFAHVWLGLAPFAQSISQTWPWSLRFSQAIQLEASVLILAGIVMFDAGRLLPRTVAKRKTVTHSNGRFLSRDRVRVFGWLVVLLAPLAVVALGGLSVQFSDRTLSGQALFSDLANGVTQQSVLGGALLKDGSGVLSFIALYSWILVVRERQRSGSSPTFADLLLLGSLVAANCVLNNPLSNARFWFGTVVIALTLLLPIFRTKLGVRAFVVLMLGGGAIIFPYGNYFRYAASTGVPQAYSVGQAFETSGDYDAAAQVASAIRYAQNLGYTYGRQVSGTLTFWVPRQLWPDKPTDTGYILGIFDGGNGTINRSAPLWAEGFIDFSWVGALLFLGAFGLGTAALDRGWRPSGGALVLRSVILPVLAGYSLILLRGSLLQAMDRLVMLTVALWLLSRSGTCDTIVTTLGTAHEALGVPTRFLTSGARPPHRVK